MESGVRVKTFSESFAGQQVHFYVLCLKQSFLLWAGTDLSFRSLSVAINTRFESVPTATQLMGDATDSSSTSFARRLAKKTGAQCFVSLNVTDPSLCQLIEEHISSLLDKDKYAFHSP